MRLPEGWWPPVALVAGGWLVAALVAAQAGVAADAPGWLLVLNQAVLLPAAILAAYAFGLVLGGRLFGLWCGAMLVLVPLAGWLYALPRYRDTYLERALVQAVGVGDGGRFAAAALLTVAAALVLASIVHSAPILGAAGGVAAGVAIVVEPSACLFVVGAILACAVARRPSTFLAFAVPVVVAGAVAVLVRDAGIGLDLSWSAFSGNMASLREYTWSNRVLQWLPLAGAIGLARRSPTFAALVAGWFGAFVLAEAASPHRPVGDGTFFVAFVPALPAFALLVAAIPLLVPGVPARAARVSRQPLL